MSEIYVPSTGPDNAKIAIVGEAPGGNEEKSRRPFVGASGQLLRSTCATVGIVPGQTFITNVCHHRPPANQIKRWAKFTQSKRLGSKPKAKINKKVAMGVVELIEDLARVDPIVTVPLGNTALWALTGEIGISKRRGSILEVSWDMARTEALDRHNLITSDFLENLSRILGKKVIPTFHPASILRRYNYLPILHTDLKRVFSDSFYPELKLPERDVIINPKGPHLEDLWQKLLTGDVLSYDIEVINSNTLYCVGFSVDPSWGLTLTADSTDNMTAIRDLLSAPIPKLAQNGIFDATFLSMYSGIEVHNFQEDTMIAQAAVYPEFPKGLDFLCSIYTREPYYKDEGKNWSPKDAEDVDRFLTYNVKDVCATLEVHQAQSADELQDEEHARTYRRVMSQHPCYVNQMTHGIKINLGEVERLHRETSEQAAELQAALDAVVAEHLGNLLLSAKKTGKEKKANKLEAMLRSVLSGRGTEKGGLNVNSSKQLKEWFYEILRFPVKKNRKTKRPTLNETALNELYAETGDKTLLTVIKIRQFRKRKSAYLNPKTDGRGYTYFSIQPAKTKTGRSSYGKTIQGYGLNMQTNPDETRSIYVPEQGYSFAYFDLAQAEARIVAYTGGISRMIEVFENDEDLHTLTASLILDIPLPDVKAHPHRYLGKRCNHAFNYEMGPYKFHDVVNNDAADTGVSLTRSEAKRLRAKHLTAYPELRVYWDWIQEKLKINRTIINPFGRKRTFPGRLNNDTYREAYSHYAQSTVADLLKTGMVKVHDYLQKHYTPNYPETRVVLEVHDAILIQYPIGAEDELFPQVSSLMEIPLITRGHEITIPVEAEYSSSSFGDLEPYVGASA